MKTIVNYVVILLAGVAACNPIELPPDISTNPTYFAFWTSENGNTEVEAGVDGYQLVSELTFQDSVLMLSSRFEEVDCFDGCGPSIEFRFYDLENNGATTIHPDLLQTNMNYPFTGSQTITAADTSTYYTILFTAKTDSTGGTPLNHDWTINDTIPFFDMASFIYTSLTTDPIFVCLTSDAGLLNPDCNTTQCRTINPVNGGPEYLKTGIELIQVGTFLQASTTGGSPPYSYSWNTGETTPSIAMNTPGGQYVVQVEDTNEGYAYSAVTTPQSPAGILCSASFEYDSQASIDVTPGDTIPPTIFGSVEVVFEEDNVRYFSSLGDSASSDFVIIDMITQVDSPVPGVELEISFEVTVYEENTLVEKVISNGEAVLFFEL